MRPRSCRPSASCSRPTASRRTTTSRSRTDDKVDGHSTGRAAAAALLSMGSIAGAAAALLRPVVLHCSLEWRTDLGSVRHDALSKFALRGENLGEERILACLLLEHL